MRHASDDMIAPYLRAALILIPALWAGMLIGVAFIATPVKFAAPTLEHAAALDVGRVTFALFSKIEWGAVAVLALVVMLAGFPLWAVAITVALAVCLAVQGIWLLPALNERVVAVIAGTPLPASHHHTVYAVLEALKLLLLVAFFVTATVKNRPGR
ncbi:MAG: hypothetical protein MJE12_12205 [Alphaproteobacteria bacterium]|nr:hypothetical protein [Alphaproteobacteria bacterium]